LIDTDLRIQVAGAIARLEAEIDGIFCQADKSTDDELLDDLFSRADSLINERNNLINYIQNASGDVRLLSGTEFQQPEPVSH
jgi:hypothetical protein